MTRDVQGFGDAVLIVGAGLGALFLALKLAPRKAVIVAPRAPGEAASSAWAQGGVAAALGPDDNAALHAADTIAAGDGLVDERIARLLAEEGPARVRDLAGLGVPFDRDANGVFSLSLEAAHSRARVARVKGDLAGRAIMETMAAAALAADHVELRAGLRAVALLSGDDGVAGVLARAEDGAPVMLEASETVLAVGGIGGLYEVTTNPPGARGDGMAAAARVGAVIADPEFVQFHPTALDLGRDPAPLATEALRGEGAALVDRDGRPLVDHPLGDLAPRDVVARAVHRARVSGRGAYLDARAAVGAAFPDKFPTVFAACASAGIDPRRELMPVAPAAHYHMGGIATDDRGRASVPGLWAVGECASTGAHGANRLASNSLLEVLVFGARAAEALRDIDAARRDGTAEAPLALPAPALTHLRETMSRCAGVERDADGLASLLAELDVMDAEHGTTNAGLAARFVATGALRREESRGGHARRDFPDTSAVATRSFLRLDGGRVAPADAVLEAAQ